MQMKQSNYALLFVLPALAAPDWPSWRGPSRNDLVSEDSGWNGAWTIKTAWRANVGEGCTSPLLVGDRVYSAGWRGGRDYIVCLNLSDGKVDWSQSYAAPQYARHAAGDQGLYSGITSTP